MRTKTLLGIFLIIALILGGCSQASDGQLVEEQLAIILTQSALEAQTAVSILPEVIPASETPLPTAQSTATINAPAATPDAVITITSIQETGAGRAIVYWDAIGDFPAGYTVVWTTETRQPLLPADDNTYTGDPNARSAMLSGLPGYVYVVRVCRTTSGGCDVYSKAGFFAFNSYAPTPTINWTKTAAAKTAIASIPSGGGGGGATATATVMKFAIVSMDGGADLKAHMVWTSDVSPSEGFRIYYSTTNEEPKQGSDSYFVIQDGKTREAYVDGKTGTTYYYRICKIDDGACVAYTASFKFTFPGTAPAATATPKPTATQDAADILIATIVDTSVGKAVITWGASGQFPEGFRVLYSASDDTPDLNDTVVTVSDSAARSAEVSGIPNTQYYFRVCKYVAGSCVVYSPVVTFKFAAPLEDAAFDLSVDGTVTDLGNVGLTWAALDPAPAGLLVLWKVSPAVPAYPADVKMQIANGAATSCLITGLTSGTTYNFRLCKFDGQICTAYSTTASATAP